MLSRYILIYGSHQQSVDYNHTREVDPIRLRLQLKTVRRPASLLFRHALARKWFRRRSSNIGLDGST